jgi:hypothetical protein
MRQAGCAKIGNGTGRDVTPFLAPNQASLPKEEAALMARQSLPNFHFDLLSPEYR